MYMICDHLKLSEYLVVSKVTIPDLPLFMPYSVFVFQMTNELSSTW